MRAIITVLGQDKVGIIAGVSSLLASHNVNILDISQTTMQEVFTMIMLVDLTEGEIEIPQLAEELKVVGDKIGIEIKIQHEGIFNSMHRI